MFRSISPKQLTSRVRDLFDSIRFLSKAERRRLYLGTAIGTSSVVTGAYLAIHTVYNENIMKHLQMYRMKFGVPVDPQLYNLLEQTLADMNVDTNSSAALFNFVGNEVYSVGSLNLPTGAYIGLPYNFSYTDPSQLKVEQIRLLGQYRTKRSINAPVIKHLFQSLILSEDAKKFAIAHQLNFLTSSYIFVKSANIFLSILGSFLLAPVVNRRLGYSTLQKRLPRVFGGLACFLAVTVFAGSIIDELLDELYDIRALRRTLKIAPTANYQTGAVEYYSKLINRNKALYELLGDHASQYYTEDGQTKRIFGLWKQSYETHLALATLNAQ